MFNTYKSKDGFTIIGTRPMFEDSDEDTLGRDIKAKFLEVFGCYPVLDICETWEIEPDYYNDFPTKLRDYNVIIDTELLDSPIYGLSYVQFLFEKIIKARLANPEATEVNTYASKKYCFSDTEDWWSAIEIKSVPEGRVCIRVEVELG